MIKCIFLCSYVSSCQIIGKCILCTVSTLRKRTQADEFRQKKFASNFVWPVLQMPNSMYVCANVDVGIFFQFVRFLCFKKSRCVGPKTLLLENLKILESITNELFVPVKQKIFSYWSTLWRLNILLTMNYYQMSIVCLNLEKVGAVCCKVMEPQWN